MIAKVLTLIYLCSRQCISLSIISITINSSICSFDWISICILFTTSLALICRFCWISICSTCSLLCCSLLSCTGHAIFLLECLVHRELNGLLIGYWTDIDFRNVLFFYSLFVLNSTLFYLNWINLRNMINLLKYYWINTTNIAIDVNGFESGASRRIGNASRFVCRDLSLGALGPFPAAQLSANAKKLLSFGVSAAQQDD